MRVIGIDPGTGSFDFFGMEGDKVILDTTIPVDRVAQDANVLIETVESVLPLDMIVGPSGYGLPVTPIREMTERELDLMVPESESIPLYESIRTVLRLMKQSELPVCFTPGVIHLPTVPEYRKANKMDMGTADKVCCIALAIRDQAEHHGIDYNQASFIMVEIGYAFNAVIGVEGGRIVDGLGGTTGGPGFLTLGMMDSELAMRLGEFPNTTLFSGGAKDLSGNESLTPEELAEKPDSYPAAWNAIMESVAKGVAAMSVSVEKPREILLSGRLSRIPGIAQALSAKLSRWGQVRRTGRRAKVAKEAAEGAYIIGEGLSGGKYREITRAMALTEAASTMYDHIFIKGVSLQKP